MKIWSIILISCLCLVGCTNFSDKDTEKVEEIEEQYEEKIAEFEKKIIDINLNYETEMKLKDDALKLAEFKVESLTNKKNSMLASIEEEKEEYNATFIPFNNRFIRQYSQGQAYLEDGVVAILEVYDNSKNLTWMKTWNGIHISEVSHYSLASVKENILYVIVDGILYVYNYDTGDLIWSLDDVGHPFTAPLIDEDGTIFTISQYVPYVSAIDKDGNFLWQERSDFYYGVSDIKFDGDNLLIDCFEGIMTFDKKGNRIE